MEIRSRMNKARSTARSRKVPVSAHPAFPAIVALWFASLLGLGSLMLSSALVDGLVSAIGIGAIISPLSPPVSVAGRILIALIAGAMGAGIGVVVARKVVEASSDEDSSHPGASSFSGQKAEKRPIFAREELGSDSFDAPVEDEYTAQPHPGRRRALSVTNESGRSEYFDAVPLPGSGAFDTSEAEASGLNHFDYPDEPEKQDISVLRNNNGDDGAQTLDVLDVETLELESLDPEILEPQSFGPESFGQASASEAFTLDVQAEDTASDFGTEMQSFRSMEQEDNQGVKPFAPDAPDAPVFAPSFAPPVAPPVADEVADNRVVLSSDSRASDSLPADSGSVDNAPCDVVSSDIARLMRGLRDSVVAPADEIQIFDASVAGEEADPEPDFPEEEPVAEDEACIQPRMSGQVSGVPHALSAHQPQIPVHMQEMKPVETRPLSELGIAELVERFSNALDRQKSMAPANEEEVPRDAEGFYPDVSPSSDDTVALHRAEEDGADPLSSETEQDQPDYFPAPSGQMVAPDMPEPEQDMTDYAPIPFTREASRNIRDAASIEAGGDSENAVFAPSAPSFPKPDSLPIALRPLDIEDEAEENDAAEDMANLSLNIDSRPRLFGSPVDPGANGLDGTFDAGIAQAAVIGEAASAVEPEQTNEPDQENALENGQESESEAEEEGYSSLLDMKSRLKQAAGRDFVRIED
ncbi:MAG: hypothetical protein ACK5NN_06985, partial [Sphingomonadaceae bacterium]